MYENIINYYSGNGTAVPTFNLFAFTSHSLLEYLVPVSFFAPACGGFYALFSGAV